MQWFQRILKDICIDLNARVDLNCARVDVNFQTVTVT